MRPNYRIGIDAGGTKSEVMVWREPEGPHLSSPATTGTIPFRPNSFQSNPLAVQRGPGINLDLISTTQATQRYQELVQNLVQSLPAELGLLTAPDLLAQSHVVFGMAGLDTPADYDHAQTWWTAVNQTWAAPARATLISDVELALWSAQPDGIGVVLIAGTGSNCFGRNRAGESAKAGGMSHFFSDEGSGWWLGWEALHALGKMYDGRWPRTMLFAAVLAQYENLDFPALKRILVRAVDYKHQVARAAPAVQQCAQDGDPWSLRTVDQALHDLSAMVQHVVGQLGDPHLPVAVVGSIFKDTWYQQRLQNLLAQHHIQAQLTHIPQPVQGALWWRG